MGKVGRPKKHDTPQKAAEAKKESDKKSTRKFNDKIKSNPELSEKYSKIRKNSKDKKKYKKQLVYVLSAILEIKSNETNPKFQKTLKAGHLKQFQQQVSCEQAEQLEF